MDFGYQSKRNRLNRVGSTNEPAQRKAAAPANEPLQRKAAAQPCDLENSANMSWLYRMLSAVQMSGDYAYSEDSRNWLQCRVDSADNTELLVDRRTSQWWEDQRCQPGPALLTLDSPLPEVADDSHHINASPNRSSPAAAAAASARSSAPPLTLQQVLSAPSFLADFRQYLEENFCAQGINFLEAYQTWEEIDPKAYPKKYASGGRKLYEQFIDPRGEEIVSIPSEVRNRVDCITNAAIKRSKKDEHDSAGLRAVLAEAKKHVLLHMEASLFPRFLKSDDYQEMLAVRFEDDSESAGAAAAFKGVGWDNSAGYQALQVSVVDAFGLNTSRICWCLLTVDSRSYRTESASHAAPSASAAAALVGGGTRPAVAEKCVNWGENFEFPITSASQFLKVTVLTHGLIDTHIFCGRVFIPIARIQEAGPQIISYKLLPRSYSDKVTGEIRLRCRLSTDPARELNHEMVPDEDQNNSLIVDSIRGLVSKKKLRYRIDGFDLDLSYITDRIIAMGFPAEGIEGVFRNNAEDVLRLFEKRHPLSYKLYNLCSERAYDPAKFKGRVARYPFDDHNPPTMDVIKEFCHDVHEWLEKHPQNVVAVHCKAGKGRTGTVIACYLVYARLCRDATSALDFFARKRTQNAKGVTIPSQIRYVHYFDHYCQRRRSGLPPPPKASLFLQEIILHNLPSSLRHGEVWFAITQNNRKAMQYKSKGHIHPSFHVVRTAADHEKGNGGKKSKLVNVHFTFGDRPMLLTEDVNVEFRHDSTFGKEKMFQYWFNTRYVASLSSVLETDRTCSGKGGVETIIAEEWRESKESSKDESPRSKSHVVPLASLKDDDEAEESKVTPGAELLDEEENSAQNPAVQDQLPVVGDFRLGVSLTNMRKLLLRQIFDKWAIDKICKDKKNKHYPASFKVEMVFLHSKKSSALGSTANWSTYTLGAAATSQSATTVGVGPTPSPTPPPPIRDEPLRSVPPLRRASSVAALEAKRDVHSRTESEAPPPPPLSMRQGSDPPPPPLSVRLGSEPPPPPLSMRLGSDPPPPPPLPQPVRLTDSVDQLKLEEEKRSASPTNTTPRSVDSKKVALKIGKLLSVKL